MARAPSTPAKHLLKLNLLAIVALLAQPVTAAPPVITDFTLTPAIITSVPATQTYTVRTSGSTVSRVMIDFGDGYRLLTASGSGTLWTGTRPVTVTGEHAATAYVMNSAGELSQRRAIWSASSPGKPTLTVSGGDPVTVQTVASPSYSISGTAGGSGISLLVTSDRGQRMVPSGTTSWSGTLTLKPGLNRVIVQVRESDGDVTSVDRLVRYEPTSALSVSNIVSAVAVERWNPLEITFDINNSAATNPYVPYEPTAPGLLSQFDGITVNGVFWLASNPSVTYTRPAFFYQGYLYDTSKSSGYDWYMPTGQPTWMLRFSPPLLGNWQYRIDVTEAKGSTQSVVRSFTVTPPSAGNHGPLVRCPTDSRYYQWADGTLWLGNGFNLEDSDDRQHLRWNLTKLDQMGSENENFVRYWLSGDFWGSMWNPWPSVDIGLDGNPPVTGLSIWSGYGDSVGCMRLGSNNRVIIQGWAKEKPAVYPNSTYVIRMRVRTDGVTGPANASYPYGLTVKSTGWPVSDTTNELTTMTFAPMVPHVKGDTPWHVVEGVVTTSSNQWFLANGINYLSIVLENTTGGTASVDGIEMYASDANGNAAGPQILRGRRMSFIQDIDPNRAWQYDQIFKRGQELGFGFMLCMAEKQDFLLQNIDVNGVPKENANGFWGNSTTAPNAYQRYYWRYLMARYAAYRSIFGWEVANEADPNAWQGYSLANQVAVMAKADGNPHFGGNSQWVAGGSWATYYKSASYQDIGWVDGHRYETVTDFANFYNSRATTWYNNNFGKPIVGGELGANNDGELAVDTDGTWLHNFMWAHTGHTGLHTLYWWERNTFNLNLHHIFGNWRRFMEGIPLGNGRYQNLSGTWNPSTTVLRVYGQKDTTAGEAHMWIQNRNHTWAADTVTPASATLTFSMGPAGRQYTVYWIDTSTIQVISTGNVTANGSGQVTLSISNLSTDIGVKLSANPVAPNEEPSPLDDKYLVGFQQTLTVSAAAGLLANDTDTDGDPLTVSGVIVSPGHGQVQVNADGSFTYTPQSTYWGTDQFWYGVSDGKGGSSSACVYVGVAPGDISNASLATYLSLNEVYGGLAFDAAPSAASVEGSGTLGSGGIWAQGKVSNCVALDGVGGCVLIPSTSDVNGGIRPQRTVALWFRVGDKSLSTRQVIYEEGDSTRGLSIYVYQNLLYIGGWNRGSGEPYWAGTWVNTGAIQNNTWHHATLVLNGTSAVTNEALIGYLDGVEFGRGNGCQLYAHDSANALGGIQGSTRFHSGTTGGGLLAGAVDELRIYNRVLTPAEIATIGTVDSTPPQATGGLINGGLTQRSLIRSLKVTFNEPVIVVGSGLTLTNLATGQPVSLAGIVFDSASNTWNVSGVTLVEGNYSAKLAAGSVTDTSGNQLQQDYIFTFHKLMGDATGDRAVNVFDLMLVRRDFLKQQGDPTRDDSADLTCDGNIDVFDLLQVQQNYLRQMPPP